MPMSSQPLDEGRPLEGWKDADSYHIQAHISFFVTCMNSTSNPKMKIGCRTMVSKLIPDCKRVHVKYKIGM